MYGVLCNVNRPSVAELQTTKSTFTLNMTQPLSECEVLTSRVQTQHALRSAYIYIIREIMS